MINQTDIHLIVQTHALGYRLLSNAYGTFTKNRPQREHWSFIRCQKNASIFCSLTKVKLLQMKKF